MRIYKVYKDRREQVYGSCCISQSDELSLIMEDGTGRAGKAKDLVAKLVGYGMDSAALKLRAMMVLSNRNIGIKLSSCDSDGITDIYRRLNDISPNALLACVAVHTATVDGSRKPGLGSPLFSLELLAPSIGLSILSNAVDPVLVLPNLYQPTGNEFLSIISSVLAHAIRSSKNPRFNEYNFNTLFR